MLEIIESNYTRSRYEEMGFRLADFQQATLIWNKANITRQERLSALIKLASETEDADLKSQIGERVAYEEKAMKQFEADLYGETLYVVFDREDNYACGYFGKYKTALTYAENYINKEKTQCVIEKHKIINGEIILSEKQEDAVEYSGEAIACLYLDENANIRNLWSNELDDIENERVDEYRRERFENQFLALPYVHHEGLPVRYIPTGEYGIVETTPEEWNCFLDSVCNGLHVDFSDTAVTVHFLTEKGHWSHRHCNPVYLEAEMPEKDINDEKQCAFCRAMDAMSAYMGGHKDEAQEKLVLKTSREYAIISLMTFYGNAF